jgi:hypothetical protein
MEFFNTLIHGRKGYPPDVKRILERHGNERITHIELRKYPIDKNLNIILNTLVAMHGKAVPYEKLFHLSMVAETDAGTNLLIEKNYVFHLETNPREYDNTQRMEVPIYNPKTVIEMLEATKEEMGEDRFFGYSSKDNNCQDWTLAFMNANLLNTPEYQEFIKQDVEQSMAGLVDLRKFLNTMTDTARWFDILKQGGAEQISKENGLSNFDIDQLLKDVTTYQGCYPKDRLPHNLKRGCWYVVNMQDAEDGGGTHWVCFKYGYPVTYYDPFGIAPPVEIMKICKRQLVWNGKQIQDETSTACGWFCVACILTDYNDRNRDTLTHFNRFINSFSDNTKVNDKILKKMLGHYSTKTPI